MPKTPKLLGAQPLDPLPGPGPGPGPHAILRSTWLLIIHFEKRSAGPALHVTCKSDGDADFSSAPPPFQTFLLVTSLPLEGEPPGMFAPPPQSQTASGAPVRKSPDISLTYPRADCEGVSYTWSFSKTV